MSTQRARSMFWFDATVLTCVIVAGGFADSATAQERKPPEDFGVAPSVAPLNAPDGYRIHMSRHPIPEMDHRFCVSIGAGLYEKPDGGWLSNDGKDRFHFKLCVRNQDLVPMYGTIYQVSLESGGLRFRLADSQKVPPNFGVARSSYFIPFHGSASLRQMSLYFSDSLPDDGGNWRARIEINPIVSYRTGTRRLKSVDSQIVGIGDFLRLKCAEGTTVYGYKITNIVLPNEETKVIGWVELEASVENDGAK